MHEYNHEIRYLINMISLRCGHTSDEEDRIRFFSRDNRHDAAVKRKIASCAHPCDMTHDVAPTACCRNWTAQVVIFFASSGEFNDRILCQRLFKILDRLKSTNTFSFLFGSMTLVIPARWAERIFSLIPPTYNDDHHSIVSYRHRHTV